MEFLFEGGGILIILAALVRWENGVWRVLVFTIGHMTIVSRPLLLPLPEPFGALVLFLCVFLVPNCVSKCKALMGREGERVCGCVFVTGCDSGMGYWTATHLALVGYTVFAGCYDVKTSAGKLKQKVRAGGADDRIIPLSLDVTSDDSVTAAAEIVAKDISSRPVGLVGIINCAGVGFNGPAEYFPLNMYQRQMDVNFFGYCRVVQSFLPLVKEAVAATAASHRRGRVIFVGTGGGVCTPVPPLLSAYMASKWAVEAFCASLRVEMQLTNQAIDAVMVNPGFVKPTALMEGGLKLTEDMWSRCRELNGGSDVAKERYGDFMDTFVEYSANQPGTHVSAVATTMEQAMRDHRPLSSFKVGFDSKVAPFVGMLPTGVREFILKLSIYGSHT